jgi:hypothetical protein
MYKEKYISKMKGLKINIIKNEFALINSSNILVLFVHYYENHQSKRPGVMTFFLSVKVLDGLLSGFDELEAKGCFCSGFGPLITILVATVLTPSTSVIS